MWTVITTNLFNEWLDQQDESTQEKVLAGLVVLQQQGPSLGRPLVDTVSNSKFTNMKELRIQHRGKPLSEPPRVSRRPNFLREYPNEKYLLT